MSGGGNHLQAVEGEDALHPLSARQVGYAGRLACFKLVTEAKPLDKRLLHWIHRLGPELGRRVFWQGEDGLVFVVPQPDGYDDLKFRSAPRQPDCRCRHSPRLEGGSEACLSPSRDLTQMGGDEAFTGSLIFVAFPWQ